MQFSLPSTRVPQASSSQEASSIVHFSLPFRPRRVPQASSRQEASSTLHFSLPSRHRSFSAPRSPRILGRVGLRRVRAEGAEVAEVEVAKSGVVEQGPDEDDENLVDSSLPPEFLELMKDGGSPPNYWVLGFGLIAAVLARKAIWAELKSWGEFVVRLGQALVDAAVAGSAEVLKWGGDPLISVSSAVCWVGLLISGFLRFLSEVTPIGPAMFAVLLSSLVLLVGESVSETYNSAEKQFPSRNVLDMAGLLGLTGFVGIIPREAMVLGLASLTIFLLAVKRVNLVAGFTPAAAVLASVSGPTIRYPVLVTFIGSSAYRYWRLGHLSPGAVHMERTAEYPRVLTGLVYLVGIATILRAFFYGVDFVTAAVYLAKV